MSAVAERRVDEADEMQLAYRYCSLSEAGLPLQEALALASRTDLALDRLLELTQAATRWS